MSSQEVAIDFRSRLLAEIPHMRAFARVLCRSDCEADDIVQTALMQAWAKQSSIRNPNFLRSWLFSIVRNAYYLERRRIRTRNAYLPSEADIDTYIAAPQISSSELSDVLREIERLPDATREAVLIVCVEGLTCEEAAHICGCPVNTIKSRVARARRVLAERLGITADETSSQSKVGRNKKGPTSEFEWRENSAD
ncbi:MAG: sigma-70 family RNA polymerase sigma factor [Hyphomicrobiaceae bacterium]